MSSINKQLSLSHVVRQSARLIPRLPGFIKSAKLLRKEQTYSPVGIGPCIEQIAQSNPLGGAILLENRRIDYHRFTVW